MKLPCLGVAKVLDSRFYINLISSSQILATTTLTVNEVEGTCYWTSIETLPVEPHRLPHPTRSDDKIRIERHNRWPGRCGSTMVFVE